MCSVCVGKIERLCARKGEFCAGERYRMEGRKKECLLGVCVSVYKSMLIWKKLSDRVCKITSDAKGRQRETQKQRLKRKI